MAIWPRLTAYLEYQNGNGLCGGIVTLITTPKFSVTFGPLALKHINLTLHYQCGSIHFKYLAILILTNHNQSEHVRQGPATA